MQPTDAHDEEGSMDFCHHSSPSRSTLMQDITSTAIHASLEDRTDEAEEMWSEHASINVEERLNYQVQASNGK